MFATIKSLAVLALASTIAHAAVVTYDWNITYVTVNLDGLFERRAIGVNGQYPPPPINVTLNDTLIINVINQLDQPTSLHTHGLFQTGNAQMDGPSMVTQCPIPPGANFTYRIPIEQHGTYWIHGHYHGQYVDGLRAPVVIHNLNETYKYDEEYTVALADWYHKQHEEMVEWYLSIFNPSGAEPVPESGLINSQTNAEFNFVPGKVYRLRIINMSALAMFHFHLDGHEMEIIEVDGIDVERTKVTSFPITAAQRYSVLVTASADPSKNYVLHADMDPSMFDVVPEELQLNVTGSIIYNKANSLAAFPVLEEWAEFDDATLVPVIPEATSNPDTTFVLTAAFSVLNDYSNKATFNDITYVMPKVPTLYTALSMGNLSSDPAVYGKYAHPMVVKHNDWVEMIINNDDPGNHPFHLHGHVFQVVGRAEGKHDPSTPYKGYVNTTNPLRRDTVLIPSGENVAIRFKANNPGVWLFHCHIEWHLQAGLATTLIEAPEIMPSVLKIDQSHFDHCKALGIPYTGNAAGKEGLDLEGANLGPDPLPGTFTGKGIVALVFTIIAALLGLATVIWYAREDDALINAQISKAKAQAQINEGETH